MHGRFLQLIKALGMSQNEFCRQVGLNPSSLTNMDNGPRSDKLANIIRRFPQVNSRWLLLGDGEMFGQEFPQPDTVPAAVDELHEKQIDWYKSQIEIKDKQIAFLMELCQKGATPQTLSQSINL